MFHYQKFSLTQYTFTGLAFIKASFLCSIVVVKF